MKHQQASNKNPLLRSVRTMLAGLVVLTGLAAGVPLAYSYLSSSQEQGIAIRAASASDIWELQGSFDVNSWKTDGGTSISVHNKSPRDLWIFFEYTDELQQVFKQTGPVMVRAGEICPVFLPSLDENDSLRVPNPLDLIDFQADKDNCGARGLPSSECKWQWKTFSGTLKIHTLNCYAVLEAPVQVPGSVLWDVYFARNFGMSSDEFCTHHQTSARLDSISTTACLTSNKAGSDHTDSPSSILKRGRDYLRQLQSFKPIDLIDPIRAAIENISPGLLQERKQTWNQLDTGAQRVQELTDAVEILLNRNQQLQDQVDDQQIVIEDLEAQLQEKESSQDPVSVQAGPVSASSSPLLPEPGDEAITETTPIKSEGPTAATQLNTDSASIHSEAQEEADEM